MAAASLLIVLRMCVHLSFRPTIVSPHQALIEAVSIAIWNKNKIAVALAIGTWAINVAFLILGRFHPLLLLQMMLNPITTIWQQVLRE